MSKSALQLSAAQSGLGEVPQRALDSGGLPGSAYWLPTLHHPSTTELFSQPIGEKIIPATFDSYIDFVAAGRTSNDNFVAIDGVVASEAGFAILSRLAIDLPRASVLVLITEPSMAEAVRFMQHGADDVLAMPATDGDLLASLSRLSRMKDVRFQTQIASKITARELEVLELLVSGHQNKGIAHTLNISQRTVEVHRARLMKKLEVESFAQLIGVAVEAGIPFR